MRVSTRQCARFVRSTGRTRLACKFNVAFGRRWPGRPTVQHGFLPNPLQTISCAVVHTETEHDRTVEINGNTKLHGIYSRQVNWSQLEEISKTEADVNIVNSDGRLPLHSLCCYGDYETIRGSEYSTWRYEPYEWLITRTKDLDTPDNDGITPLHLAAMNSEPLVQRLLLAGADPVRATQEGLTPLHLAARARQSNIVGLLIAGLRKSFDDIGPYLNAKDQDGRSPLHHACRSGRHETVILLLEAGAGLDSCDRQGLTPMEACVEFEEEQELWSDYYKPDLSDCGSLDWAITLPENWNANVVGGAKLREPLRPWVLAGRHVEPVYEKFYKQCRLERNSKWGVLSPQHTTRLEDIVQLLVNGYLKTGKPAADIQRLIAKCIEKSTATGTEYTSTCFKYLRYDLATSCDLMSQEVLEEYENLRKRDLEVLLTHRAAHSEGALDGIVKTVKELLRLREYRAIELLLFQELHFEAKDAHTVRAILDVFASHGFRQLLAGMFNHHREISKSVMENSHELNIYGGSVDPLLIAACTRELPNMDVITYLVEEARLDINVPGRIGLQVWMSDVGQFQDMPSETDYDCEDPIAGENTALHEVAKGRHWWYVERAMPYLVSSGADTKRGNEWGETPLQHAEKHSVDWVFTENAIKMLKDQNAGI